jgi:hypothetical protein
MIVRRCGFADPGDHVDRAAVGFGVRALFGLYRAAELVGTDERMAQGELLQGGSRRSARPCDRTLEVMKTNDDAGPVVEALGDSPSQIRAERSRQRMMGSFTERAWRRECPQSRRS